MRVFESRVFENRVLRRIFELQRDEVRLRVFENKVFENRVLRRISELQRDEVTGEWRKLHNEKLNYPYSLPNIVRVMNSRRVRLAGRVACMGRRKAFTGETRGKETTGETKA
jgi:hypothetical protein